MMMNVNHTVERATGNKYLPRNYDTHPECVDWTRVMGIHGTHSVARRVYLHGAWLSCPDINAFMAGG